MSAPDTPVMLENRCHEELAVGESASLTRTLTQQDIEVFAILSGDVNPAHLDEAYARETPFHQVIAHGMWGGTLISTVLGTRLPGPGTIYVAQSLAFLRPVGLGDVITVTVTVKAKSDHRRVLLDCVCRNQLGKPVITGEAEVIAPAEKVRRPATPLPDLALHHHDRFAQLMARARGLAPARCAVIWPMDEPALSAALEAQQAGLIEPVLVGPREAIEALARTHGLDLGHTRWHACGDRASSVLAAMQLAQQGKVEALMQGGANHHDLLHALMARDTGLRIGRRISHAWIADVPGQPDPLLITDAALNIQPTLDDQCDIAQNAIELAHKM
jgi:phosphate butyryltransferase